MSLRIPPARAPMHERMRARRRAVARGRVRRRRRVLGSLLAVALIAGVAVGVAMSPLFAVDDVRVVGLGEERARAVRTVAGVRPGTNLLAADLHGAAGRVAELAWVGDVSIGRVPPSTVEIRVRERRPVAVVHTADEAWLIDGEAVVLPGEPTGGLVTVDAPNSVLPGPGVEVSDAAVRNALAVHAALPRRLRAAVDRYDAPSERGLRLRLDVATVHGAGQAGAWQERVWVRFGAAEQVPAKARVIIALLQQAGAQASRRGEQAAVAELDVRVPDNPVLVPAEPDDADAPAT